MYSTLSVSQSILPLSYNEGKNKRDNMHVRERERKREIEREREIEKKFIYNERKRKI